MATCNCRSTLPHTTSVETSDYSQLQPFPFWLPSLPSFNFATILVFVFILLYFLSSSAISILLSWPFKSASFLFFFYQLMNFSFFRLLHTDSLAIFTSFPSPTDSLTIFLFIIPRPKTPYQSFITDIFCQLFFHFSLFLLLLLI